MSEESKTKVKPETVKRVPKPRLKKGATLELRGFPYPITDALLQGPKGWMHIKAIQNWEKAYGAQVLGTLIIMD